MLTTEFVIDLSSMDPAQLERDWDQERAEKARLRAERQRKADEAEAAAARRKADDEAAQRQRDREARKKRREHIASLDRGPMIDALRLGVVQIDRRKYPRRNALDHLIENFESGGWGSVHIECPECQVRGSRLWLDDKDGSIKAQCAGKPDAEGWPEECTSRGDLTDLVQHYLDAALADEEEDEHEDDDLLPPMVNLADLLAEPDDEQGLFLIDQLLPTGGRVIWGGPAKAGKTAGVDNLVRSLVDHEPFLGCFEVTAAVTRVVVIDLEVIPKMTRNWFARLDLRHPDRVDLMPLRDNARMLDLHDQRLRSAWVKRLAGADMVILDCLGPVLDALKIPETRITSFLNLWGEVLAEAGVPHAVVVHHHNDAGLIGGGNRVRGWSDGLWNTVMLDDNDEASPRFFSAVVRGGGVGEGRLEFEPETGLLTFTQGTRADAKADARSEVRRSAKAREKADRRQSVADDHMRVMEVFAKDRADQLAAGVAEVTWKASDFTSLMVDSGLSENRLKAARLRVIRDGLMTETPGPGNSKVYAFTDRAVSEFAMGSQASEPSG